MSFSVPAALETELYFKALSQQTTSAELPIVNRDTGETLTGEAEGVGALADPTQLMAGTRAEPVRGPVVRTHVVAQPRHLCHDDASPLALVPVRGAREVPGPLCTR